jgi:hypothetical protein
MRASDAVVQEAVKYVQSKLDEINRLLDLDFEPNSVEYHETIWISV